MRRFLATAMVTAFALVGLSACGDDGASGESDAEPKQIKIRFRDGTVTPSGDRIEVKAGQEVELVVAADEPGEIHVHSDPEKELEYDEGEEIFTLEFDRPGVVEVESHELEEIIVQLEVN
jgi:plastocyanin